MICSRRSVENCSTVKLAITDPKVFDNICSQAVQNSRASKTGVPQVAANGTHAPSKSTVKSRHSTGGAIIATEGIAPK